MMLIRVMGGSIGQVKKLFMILGAYIVGIGCIGGCVLSFITGNILFKLFAGRFNLVKEAQDVSLTLDLFVCFVTFFVVMLFCGGLKLRWFLGAFAAVLLSFPFIWNTVLKNYQKIRILVVFDPSLDPDKAYHALQSQIAIKCSRQTR